MQVAAYDTETILRHITEKKIDLDLLFKHEKKNIGGIIISIYFHEWNDDSSSRVQKKLDYIAIDGTRMLDISEAKKVLKQQAKEIDPSDDVKEYLKVVGQLSVLIDNVLEGNNIPVK